MANETYLKFRTMLQGKRIGFIRLDDFRNESEIIRVRRSCYNVGIAGNRGMISVDSERHSPFGMIALRGKVIR